MKIPAKTMCDLCGIEITDPAKAVQILVPIDGALRKKIVAHITKTMPPGLLSIYPADAHVPQKWAIEACECVLGFIATLPEIVSRDVEAALERAELRRRAQTCQAGHYHGGDS